MANTLASSTPPLRQLRQPPQIEVRRSARRRRTVTAYRENSTLVVLIPATMSRAEERHWVAEMERKLLKGETQRKSAAQWSDQELLTRSLDLSTRYLGGVAIPKKIRWVPTMRTRWASCTPAEKSIRISEQLRHVPGWVLDYVLVHELAHLLVEHHNADFWALVARYPKTERAIGYLEGLSAAAQLGITEVDPA